MTSQRYELLIAPTARRRLAELGAPPACGGLPGSVAFAAYEFIVGPLLENPHGVGKPLRPTLKDGYSARRGTYRVIYRIDDTVRRVTVVGVFGRAEAYRTR